MSTIVGVVDTGKQLIVGVVDIKLRISPRIFVKFEMVPLGYLRARGKLFHEKKPEVVKLVSDSI